MKRIITVGMACLVALVAGVTFLRPSLSLAELKPGDPAPAFSLQDEAGNTVTLTELKGKIVVLEWTNPDCPFVKRHGEEGTMRTLAEKFAKSDVVWFAVNSSKHMTTEANIAWKKQASLPYSILDDRTGQVGKLYGARTTPHMFIIDREQKVAYNGAIDSDNYGDDESRTNYVEVALDALLAGAPVKTAQTEPYGCSVKYAS